METEAPATQPVVCPYCQVQIGTAPAGWLIGVMHGLAGQHSFLTANPAVVKVVPSA